MTYYTSPVCFYAFPDILSPVWYMRSARFRDEFHFRMGGLCLGLISMLFRSRCLDDWGVSVLIHLFRSVQSCLSRTTLASSSCSMHTYIYTYIHVYIHPCTPTQPSISVCVCSTHVCSLHASTSFKDRVLLRVSGDLVSRQ